MRKITLITSYDDSTDLKELAASLEVTVNENLHDREIRIDN